MLKSQSLGMKGAIRKAEEILASLGDAGFMLQQFKNPDNPKVIYLSLYFFLTTIYYLVI